MTPDNDKTLRGIFHNHTVGLDEWNDRREYRLKYENEYSLSGKKRLGNIVISMINENGRGGTGLLRKNISESYEDYVMYVLGKFFPESKEYQKFRWYWSFGMCADIDGNYTDCDCCGCRLNALNTKGYGICDACDIDNQIEMSEKKTGIAMLT